MRSEQQLKACGSSASAVALQLEQRPQKSELNTRKRLDSLVERFGQQAGPPNTTRDRLGPTRGSDRRYPDTTIATLSNLQ